MHFLEVQNVLFLYIVKTVGACNSVHCAFKDIVRFLRVGYWRLNHVAKSSEFLLTNHSKSTDFNVKIPYYNCLLLSLQLLLGDVSKLEMM